MAGVLRAGVLGMLLAVPTIWTGSLFPAIVGHFWINAAVGLGGWRFLLEDPRRIENGPTDRAPGRDEEES